MAYTQLPGRKSMPKTGRDLPSNLVSSPMKQMKESTYTPALGAEIEKIGARNKAAKLTEAKAVKDSISAARDFKGSIFKKRQAGNVAANITRKAGGVDEVQRFSNPHEYTTYQPRTGEKDTYIRKSSVEKDVPMERNKKTGELDIKKKAKKSTPAKMKKY